jgi:hypothetical protein
MESGKTNLLSNLTKFLPLIGSPRELGKLTMIIAAFSQALRRFAPPFHATGKVDYVKRVD